MVGFGSTDFDVQTLCITGGAVDALAVHSTNATATNSRCPTIIVPKLLTPATVLSRRANSMRALFHHGDGLIKLVTTSIFDIKNLNYVMDV